MADRDVTTDGSLDAASFDSVHDQVPRIPHNP